MSDHSDAAVARWDTSRRKDLDHARLYRALFEHRSDLVKHYPWVSIPQIQGSFTFGDRKGWLPLGALIRLWEHWPLLRGACPRCKSLALGFSFSGFLSAGRIRGVCIGCGLLVNRWIGGIGRIVAAVRPILQNTPFFLQGGWGVIADGPPVAALAVLQELGAQNLPRVNSPSFKYRAASDQPSQTTHHRKGNSSAKRRRKRGVTAPRRYLVKEVVLSMAWSGVIWAVGCSSRDSAERALRQRVARNIAESGEPGSVLAYDRETKSLICWSEKIVDPEAAQRWWFK